MKQILVIGSTRADASDVEPVSAVAAYVQTTLGVGADEVAVAYCQADELVQVLEASIPRITVAPAGQPLESYDFVWFRGKTVPILNDLAIVAQYLQRHNVPFANPNYADRTPYGKLAQMYILAEHNLPYPKTISALPDYLPAAVQQELTYPIILKANHGAHGNSNYLIHDEAELQATLADEPEVQFIAQEFIANNGDYRLLLVADKHLIIHRKGDETSHLNNTSKGGTATLVADADFPAEVLAAARQFAAACNYTVAGVDVMFAAADNKPYFLEANSQPQLMTGAFIDEKAALAGEFFRNQLGL